MVPTKSPTRRFHSEIKLAIEAVSPAQGGRYQMQNKTGPISACRMCQLRSCLSECSSKVMFSAISLKANKAIPPPHPSRRSRLEINEYPEMATDSIDLSKKVSFKARSCGGFSTRFKCPSSSARFPKNPRMFKCSKVKCSKSRCKGDGPPASLRPSP